MSGLRDSYARVIDYLRISITDKCNLRCIYCMPDEGVAPVQHGDVLSYEEILRIAEVAARLGVRKLRLTGGEPLVRKNLVFLISALKKIGGIEDLSLTTNGQLLANAARDLKNAGLDRVNVSIDSFIPERYRRITRGGDLEVVRSGLRAADEAGLKPLKINMVPIRGLNDDEIEDFARITADSAYHVRFIECMPTAESGFWSPERYITTDEIMERIRKNVGGLTAVRARKNGPSKYYRLEGAKGVVGFISALTHHFCDSCNRLRLTADGKLRPCLFSESEIDLRAAIRSGAPDSEIERLLRLAIAVKPEGHKIGSRSDGHDMRRPDSSGNSPGISLFLKRPMSKIGG
ncbi:MAG: GTP 3',8-cyclase MoaA [Thermodesulfovibrionales bacterium]